MLAAVCSGSSSCYAPSVGVVKNFVILFRLFCLIDFIVADSEFTVNEVGRRLFIYSDLKHFGGLFETSFVTENVAEVFRNAMFARRCGEALFEDTDSDVGSGFRIKKFVNAKAVNWNRANDLAIAFVMVAEIDAITAKKVRVVADSFGKAYVYVAVSDRSIGKDVFRLDDEEIVLLRFGQYAGIDWFK